MAGRRVRGAGPPCGRPSRERPTEADLEDSGPHGLQKFDLGLVPASVTPPRTWRRAAWFTGIATAAALTGLVGMSVALFSPRPEFSIDSLPAVPTGQPMPRLELVPGPDRQTFPSPPTAVVDQSEHEGSASSHRGEGIRTEGPDDEAGGGQAEGAEESPGTPDEGAGSSGADPEVSTLGPTTTAARPEQASGVTTDEYKHQTVAFLDSVVHDLPAAYALLGGRLRAAGLPALRDRYEDVRDISIEHILIDPANATTLSTLVVTRPDGSQTKEYRQLRFRDVGGLLIEDDQVVPRPAG
ncbi:hypothetical protein [Actinoalloteichus spitiensis]|uniref:hypothetical protein n=1 Tax=Actinoalloteichus spitiensis TaxID=252394 RepID=UPI0012F64816|nr:hypothetical protein [Actinoalloteichus spitiensis]